MNTEKIFQSLAEIGGGVSVADNPELKERFHKVGRQAARCLATMLGLQKGTYDVRSNMGGIAVSGEITLHGERIYVQFAQSACGPGMGFMFRACLGRKDYTGRCNHWMEWDALARDDSWVKEIKRVMETESNTSTPETGRLV